MDGGPDLNANYRLISRSTTDGAGVGSCLSRVFLAHIVAAVEQQDSQHEDGECGFHD